MKTLTTGTLHARCGPPRDTRELTAAIIGVLTQLLEALAPVTPEQYTRAMGPVFCDASMGGQTRHTLDHARALLEALVSGTACYDHRERGTRIELDPVAARDETRRLIDALGSIDAAPAGTLRVSDTPARDGPSVTLESSVARELVFVLSHSVHHLATLRGMLVSLDLPVPAGLGYAPSTLAYLDGAPCAR